MGLQPTLPLVARVCEQQKAGKFGQTLPKANDRLTLVPLFATAGRGCQSSGRGSLILRISHYIPKHPPPPANEYRFHHLGLVHPRPYLSQAATPVPSSVVLKREGEFPLSRTTRGEGTQYKTRHEPLDINRKSSCPG